MREAIVQLSDRELEAIGLQEIVAATREAGLQDVTELVCHGTGGVVQIRVDEPIPAADLDRFESVVWWERLTTSESDVVYLCKIEPAGDEDVDTTALDEHATAHEVSDVHEGGVDLSIVGSEAEIRESIAVIDEAGMSPLLERLTDFEGSGEAPTEALTDRQQEVVETAYAMGYYEVPRTASTEEVADEVGLDPSTVAEHLQRAERNMVAQVVQSAR